ncbi:GNAT family N-acetyltransferase [Kribbella sp. NPDC023855]|uniref:GNAT family N-acetyltransferase n=1 Tax=Kribbella sp. NPDC023855 TaxID=3154698 RepID=UPI0033EAEA3C
MKISGDEYVVRPGIPDDIAVLAAMNEGLHPYPGVGPWTRDLFERHPFVDFRDFVVAESRTERRIAASLVAINQQWTLGGTSVPAVQIELVGSDPRDRGHNLTGRMLDAVHQRCRTMGPALQLISGIPYFYRRFGYEYAVRPGDSIDVAAAVLQDHHCHSELDFFVRPAVSADAPALAGLDRSAVPADVLRCHRDETSWVYELSGRRKDSLPSVEVAVITDRLGAIAGYVVNSPRIGSDGALKVFAAECVNDDVWAGARAVMLRYLADAGAAAARRTGSQFTALRMLMPDGHQLMGMLPPVAVHRAEPWYARSGDLGALLKWCLPALAARWREHGWPRSVLVLDTYHEVIRLHFAAGRLHDIDVVARDALRSAADVVVPPGALLQLILGYATPSELLQIWPDMSVPEPTTLDFLAIGFPRLSASVWSVI